MKTFSDLTEQEIIALAISSEDDDARSYAGFAHALMADYPASAKVFVEMAEEEHEHRRRNGARYQHAVQQRSAKWCAAPHQPVVLECGMVGHERQRADFERGLERARRHPQEGIDEGERGEEQEDRETE